MRTVSGAAGSKTVKDVLRTLREECVGTLQLKHRCSSTLVDGHRGCQYAGLPPCHAADAAHRK